MKKTVVLIGALAFLLLAAGPVLAQAQGGAQPAANTERQPGPRFIDENGDGICDLMRDHDNDGIPNSQDPDWQRPQDGSGNQHRFGFRGQQGPGAGQGFCNAAFRNGFGPFGSGVCDGTGPRGLARRQGGNR